MKFFISTALATSLMFTPVYADEFTDTIELVLEAYNAGDIKTAKAELDYANQLLQEMLGENFTKFLPEAMDGWTREMGDGADAAALAMFGGGVTAEAIYFNGSNELKITIMADNALVGSMRGMLSDAATMAVMGELVRVGRRSFLKDGDEILGMVGDVLIQVSGGVSEEENLAYLETMDMDALADY